MSLQLQVLIAAAIFALASIAATTSSAIQLKALGQSEQVAGVGELTRTTLAELQARVNDLEAGEQDLGREARNGKVFARSVVITEGFEGHTFEVELTIKETSELNEAGLKIIKRKMTLFR